ncbi:MAG: DUF2817 domain-containing protein [Ignavibacteriales bacterium]|nr:DUF2817 domain-containing protein [Ignavibacteriales bacterium]
MKYLIALLLFLNCQAQEIQTPLEKSNYTKLSSNEEIIGFVKEAAAQNSLIKFEIIGRTIEGRNIPAVKISTTEFGIDKTKIKVLIFAQQHGNEHSGKEGSLMLLKEIAGGKLNHLFKKIDLILIPQMNPDGSERDERRNSHGMDLNRNHLILTEPETQALHKLFNQYLPEVTADVHEYYPYSKDWLEYGYIKNHDEQIGSITNPNVSLVIKNYTRKTFLPFIKESLNKNGFTSFEYIPGGPPEKERIRLSTYDINDGRQSLGILNSFSVIFEGKNGKDSIDNIKHRAEGQCAAMKALLEFVYNDKDRIINMVESGREKLLNSKPGEKIAIRVEHVKGDELLALPLRSVRTGKDTIVTVKEYHPVDKILLEVEKPIGYLIPKADSNLTRLLKLHDLKYENFIAETFYNIEEYRIVKIDFDVVEEDSLLYPKVEKKTADINNPDDYYFVPTRQLHSNMLVLGLEPQSTLGIVQYKIYKYLLEIGKSYPILRVVKK